MINWAFVGSVTITGDEINLDTVKGVVKKIETSDDGMFRISSFYENGQLKFIIHDKCGVYHNSSGPAIVKYEDGNITVQIWYKDGKRHNESGPGFIEHIGNEKVEAWYFEDKLHNPNGPAWSGYKDNVLFYESWYIHGKSRSDNYHTIHYHEGMKCLQYIDRSEIIKNDIIICKIETRDNLRIESYMYDDGSLKEYNVYCDDDQMSNIISSDGKITHTFITRKDQRYHLINRKDVTSNNKRFFNDGFTYPSRHFANYISESFISFPDIEGPQIVTIEEFMKISQFISEQHTDRKESDLFNFNGEITGIPCYDETLNHPCGYFEPVAIKNTYFPQVYLDIESNVPIFTKRQVKKPKDVSWMYEYCLDDDE